MKQPKHLLPQLFKYLPLQRWEVLDNFLLCFTQFERMNDPLENCAQFDTIAGPLAHKIVMQHSGKQQLIEQAEAIFRSKALERGVPHTISEAVIENLKLTGQLTAEVNKVKQQLDKFWELSP